MALKDSSSLASYATFDVGGSVSRQALHPQECSWWFSRLFLGWATPLMTLGHMRQLSIDDLWPLRKSDKTEFVSVRFCSYFQCNKSILKSFLHTFNIKFVLTGVASLFSILCSHMGPIVLDRVVSSLTTETELLDLSSVFGWILTLFTAQFCRRWLTSTQTSTQN